MKSRLLRLAAHILALPAMSASAGLRYVNVNSATPVPPYTNWTTAASTIQDAVDAAAAGDQILVTNGVYQTGGRAVAGAMTNRVAVDKPVTVQSVNGAAVTVIRGFQVPDTTNGDSAIRCVYLTNGAALMGFTLTNGATREGGSSDYEREQFGGGVWCESTNALVSHCVLTGNSAYVFGGGASGGTLNNCMLDGNSAYGGGGAYGGALNNCTLTGNSATGGGGAASSTLNNCTITTNSASYGGGASEGMLNNCTLTANSATSDGGGGGGAYQSTLNNCMLTLNSAYFGGGAYGGTLNNCTLTGNSAYNGGGAYGGTLNNCIVYYNNYNSARNWANNYSESALSYSCTTPLPPEGTGNISAEPLLTDLSHLSADSPCRGTGSARYATGLDIDGETWANPPSIGCDEYHPGAVTGPLSVTIQAAYTNVAVGFTVNFTAAIDGHATANRWEFGDGTVVSNRQSASHSWAAEGDYLVVLQAYNDTYPGGVSATVTVHVVVQPVHNVALGNANPVAPYTSWATAANNIQDAVDAASVAGALVLVTNGVYQTGGPADARVVVTKPLELRSVNGAAVTVIQGFRDPDRTDYATSVRCVSLANGAALVGFTLTNGAAPGLFGRGGGVRCQSASEIVSNCVLTGNSVGIDGTGGGVSGGTLYNCTLTANSATHFGFGGGGARGSTLNNCTLIGNSTSDGHGGGAVFSTLNNCILTGNSAYHGEGGGAYMSTLNNCALSGNSASGGGGVGESTLNNCTLTANSATSDSGGAYLGTLNNCIIYYNSAPNGANYWYSLLSYSCTTPLPTNGIGNLTNAPLFVGDAGNLRLQSNSPCINAGSNASAPAGPDLDGNPRVVGGTVDMGAYEFQAPQSLISYAWLTQYALPVDGSADVTDTDGDGLNNWQEWRTGTNPTNALSVLRLLSPVSGAPGVILSWQSVSGLNYFLERGTNLGAKPPFLPLATNIIGQPGKTTFTDTNAVGPGPFFYRVGVQK